MCLLCDGLKIPINTNIKDTSDTYIYAWVIWNRLDFERDSLNDEAAVWMLNKFVRDKYMDKYRLMPGVFLMSAIMIIVITFCVFFNTFFQEFYKNQLKVKHEKIAKDVIATEYSFWKQSSYLIDNIDVALYVSGQAIDITTKLRAIKAIDDSRKIFNVNQIDIISIEQNVIYDGESLKKIDLEEYFQMNPNMSNYYTRYANGENLFVSDDGYYVTYFNEDYRGFIVVFETRYDEIRNKMISTGLSEDENLWVYYKNTTPIVSNDKEMVDREIYERLTSNGERQNAYINNNYYYLYTDYRGVSCISRVKYFNMIRIALKKSTFVWVLTVLLFATIAAATYLISNHNKRQALLFATSIAKLNERTKVSRVEHAMLRLFTHSDNVSDVDDEEVGLICEQFEDKGFSAYCAMIYMLDDSAQKVKKKILGEVSAVVKSVLSAKGKCEIVKFSEDKLGVLFATNNQESTEVACKYIGETIKEEYNETITIVKSMDESSVTEAIFHISDIVKLCMYRFISGVGSFIDQEKISVVKEESKFPIDIQRQLIKVINDNDLGRAEECLKEFIEYVDKNDYMVAEEWTLTLFMNVIRNVEERGKSVDFSTIASFVKSDTFMQAAEKFIAYMKNNEVSVSEINPEDVFIKEVKRIVEENYSNLDFNLGDLARRLNISEVYAGRKFKVLYGQNFSNYLSTMRIAKSRELLSETNIKINEIAEMCGFNSPQYFATCFKRNTNMTPQAYRAAMMERRLGKENENENL